MKEIGKYQVIEIDRNNKYEVVKSAEHAKHEFRTRSYLVLVDIQSEDYTCICGMFQKDGLLCAHVLAVLIRLNILTLQNKYFIDRWRPTSKISVSAVPNAFELVHGNSSLM